MGVDRVGSSVVTGMKVEGLRPPARSSTLAKHDAVNNSAHLSTIWLLSLSVAAGRLDAIVTAQRHAAQFGLA